MKRPEPRRTGRRPEPPEGLGSLGGAIRDLVDTALHGDADRAGLADALARAEALVREARTLLEPFRASTPGLRVGRDDDPAGARSYWVRVPASGRHNPGLPDPDLVEVEGETRGSVTLGPAFEGPPGCVHGGFVALMFDELLGFQNGVAGTHGVTGSLEVRYRRPTPLYTPLELRAWTERSTRRRIVTCGELRVGDRVHAEARGLFVRPPGGFDRLLDSVQDE